MFKSFTPTQRVLSTIRSWRSSSRLSRGAGQQVVFDRRHGLSFAAGTHLLSISEKHKRAGLRAVSLIKDTGITHRCNNATLFVELCISQLSLRPLSCFDNVFLTMRTIRFLLQLGSKAFCCDEQEKKNAFGFCLVN